MRYLALLLLTLPLFGEAATLSLTPDVSSLQNGGTVTVEVWAETEGQAILAAEGELSYDPAILEPIFLASGPSLSLWATEPTVSAPGTILFSGWAGGTPQIGRLSLARVTFRALQAGEPEIAVVSGALLANDGKSSNVLSTLGRTRVTIRVPTEGQVLGASTIDAPPPPPVFTVYAERAGDPLVIVGTADTGSRVVLTLIGVGGERSYKAEASNGAFTIIGERLAAGSYSVYGETYSKDGVLGSKGREVPVTVLPSGEVAAAAAAFLVSPSYATLFVAIVSFLFGFLLYYLFTLVRRR